MRMNSLVLAVGMGVAVQGSFASGAEEGILRSHRGVWILSLRGSRVEMAAQHGRLVADRIAETALPYFADRIRTAVRQAGPLRKSKALARAAELLVDLTVMAPLRRRLTEEDQAVARAFAQGSGYPEEKVLDGWVVPDAGQWLVGQVFGGLRPLAGAYAPLPPALGCSSFVTGDAEEGLIHARNLDYDSYGVFDANPVVIYFHPSDPNEQSYASFSSLGLHTAGITAVNESGVALGLHQTMVDDARVRGTPILSITESVIRGARTLDEAIAILRAARFTSSWNVILSSAREGRAASVEVSPSDVSVFELDGSLLARTNHVMSPVQQAKEFSYDYMYSEDTRARLANLEAMFAGRASIAAPDAVDAISSAVDFRGGRSEDRTHHRIVAKMNNIQSVVMSARAGIAYVAVPVVAGSKPVEGRYVPVPMELAALRAGGEAGLEAALASMPGDLAPSRGVSEARARAHSLYREAAVLAGEQSRFGDAAERVGQARALEPGEAIYPLMEGILLFRAAGEVGRDGAEALVEAAAERLVDARALGLSAYHQSLASLFLGRSADLLGHREEALGHYGRVDREFSEPLAKAAKRGLREAYRLGRIGRLVVDVIHGDVFRF